MIEFKSVRERLEFSHLELVNLELCTIVQSLSQFCALEFKKEVVITSVMRTQAEHEALYAATPAEKRPASSPHMTGEAVDIRSVSFTLPEIERMVKFLNQFSSGWVGKNVAMYHQVPGNVYHFHTQRKRS